MAHRILSLCLASLVALFALAPANATDFVSPDEAREIGLRPFWTLNLPVRDPDLLARLDSSGENVYALSADNIVMAVHGGTGVLRWSEPVSKPGHRVLGPTLSNDLTLYTTQAGVHLFNTRTGQPAADPRRLNGVVIETVHDNATINLGRVHGLELGTMLSVHRRDPRSGKSGEKIADLRVTIVRERQSVGHVTRLSPTANPDSGDPVVGEINVAVSRVELPFAPSSPAIGHKEFVYYGASNGRLYKLSMLDGIREWEFSTGGPASATPRIFKDDLFVASQNGRVYVSATGRKRERWTFATEGAIFVDPWVDDSGVYVASTDQSLYALEVLTGARRWRQQFATSDLSAPVVAADTVFISAKGDGLYAFETQKGKTAEQTLGRAVQRWRFEGDAKLLAVEGDRVFVAMSGGLPVGGLTEIVMLDLMTGERIASIRPRDADFAVASTDPITIVIGDRLGHLQCLRSSKAPYLRPEDIANVLAADRAIAAGEPPRPATPSAGRAVPAETLDDPFRSKSTVQPIGAQGPAGAEKPPARETGPGAEEKKPEEAAEEEEEEEEEEEAEGEEEKKSDDEGDKEKEDEEEEEEEEEKETP